VFGFPEAFILVIVCVRPLIGSDNMTDAIRYVPTPTGFLMVLREGDDVLERLEALMQAEDVPSASLTGFGFAASARFGFFDHDRGHYDPADFSQLEIAALIGTLAWKDGAPSIHAHASGASRDFEMVGGHVLGLVVGRGSFEITVATHPKHLVRRHDALVGGNVLQLGSS
jgi:uncharacterized protein